MKFGSCLKGVIKKPFRGLEDVAFLNSSGQFGRYWKVDDRFSLSSRRNNMIFLGHEGVIVRAFGQRHHQLVLAFKKHKITRNTFYLPNS